MFQSDLESDLKRTVSELVAEALTKNDFLAGGKQTMTVSRFLILPSEIKPIVIIFRGKLAIK